MILISGGLSLKFLRGDDPELLVRFQQEAKAQARLDSKHICKVYEVGEAEGRRYIAMQFIAGQTFAHAASQMNIEQKVAIMRDMAEAVHSAHKQGLIHRDVKPARTSWWKKQMTAKWNGVHNGLRPGSRSRRRGNDNDRCNHGDAGIRLARAAAR